MMMSLLVVEIVATVSMVLGLSNAGSTQPCYANVHGTAVGYIQQPGYTITTGIL